jgi:lincosamide nucleotidyltransferase A/C/D/E
MVSAEDAVEILDLLSINKIPIWLTGGWGIDALLGNETRTHNDLDVILKLDDVAKMCSVMSGQGFGLKEYWSENLFVQNTEGNEVSTAFALKDSRGREFDAHALYIDRQGNGIPAWEEAKDFIFKAEDFKGVGTIIGRVVRCITSECQVYCHTGYELPEYQKKDLDLLRGKFGLQYFD